jgi:integrase
MASHPAALQRAFDDWLAHQRVAGRLRRGSSEAVYRAMWQALAAWCLTQRPALRLADLQGQALLAYLASRSGMLAADGALTPRYQQRLVSLVQRVRQHQAWQRQQAEAGPAQALALASGALPSHGATRWLATSTAAAGSLGDPPPLHLPPDQADQLQALLCDATDDDQARWQRLRDRCAVALQLGAGLGPGDVRSLRLADVRASRLTGTQADHPAASTSHAPSPPPNRAAQDAPDESTAGAPTRWHLQVPASGSAPAHAAPLAGWAAAVLARWLAVRRAQALGGTWLLPSTRSGKPWGKVAQYESARRVLADAGLDADGGGSFRLRHSFAMRQLQHGHDPSQVGSWLGVVDPQVLLRYQNALAGKPETTVGQAVRSGQPETATVNAPPWPV